LPSLRCADGGGTAGRDGGQDSHGAGQGSYQVTSVRPVGARHGQGTGRQISLKAPDQSHPGSDLTPSRRPFQYESHTHLLVDTTSNERPLYGLVFEARVDDHRLRSVDLIEIDESADRIATITVMARPNPALMALGARMTGSR